MKTLTEKELQMIHAFIWESNYNCGDFSEAENLSYSNANDLVKELGWSKQEVGGVMSALSDKGLIMDNGDSARGAKINDWVAIPQTCVDYPQINLKFGLPS